jgi:uncharacterized membrane protein YfcA
MTNIFLYLLVGLAAGVISGLIGIGGGTIIVPVLVFLFGLSQHQAQGTTLALLVPPSVSWLRGHTINTDM